MIGQPGKRVAALDYGEPIRRQASIHGVHTVVVRRYCQRYPSDVTDTEWTRIASHLHAKPGPGRPRELDIRALFKASRSINRTGCQWEYLPKDFPNQNRVRYSFDRWTGDDTFVKSNDALRAQARRRLDRDVQPMVAIIDSQRIKKMEAGGERGFDGKKVKGRKRHSVVDPCGHLLRVKAHAADRAEAEGGKQFLTEMRPHFPELKQLWCAGGYGTPGGEFAQWAEKPVKIAVEVVQKLVDQVGFIVLSRR